VNALYPPSFQGTPGLLLAAFILSAVLGLAAPPKITPTRALQSP